MKQISGMALVVMAALLLGACGTIPMGTMWKMYRMGPDGLLNSNAEEVRAAVLSDAWFLDDRNFDAGRLEIQMTRADESVESFTFILEDVSDRELFQLEPAGPGQRWRVYEIERDALATFQAMQSQLSEWLDTDEFKGGGMSIAVKFDNQTRQNSAGTTDETSGDDVATSSQSTPGADPDTHPKDAQVRIDLRLRENDGYFSLIRGYTLSMVSDGDEG